MTHKMMKHRIEIRRECRLAATCLHHVLVYGVIVYFYFGLVGQTFAEKIVIEIGSLAAPQETLEWIRTEIRSFQQSHPEIVVEEFQISEPKRDVSPISSDPPLAKNVVGIDSREGYEVAYLAEKGLIKPLDELIKDNNFDLDAFYPALWDSARYKNKIWGVPWYALSYVLLCDMDVLQAAGIENIPASWDEFLEISSRLAADTDNDGAMDRWALRLSSSDDSIATLLLSMVLQKGGTLMSDGKFDISHSSYKESLMFLRRMVTENVARIDSRQLSEVLQVAPQQYAMHLVGTHRLGAVADLNRFRLATIPSFSKDRKEASPRRLYFAVRTATPAEEQASWEFIQWITGPSVSMPAVDGPFPCRRDLFTRSDYLDAEKHGLQNVRLIVSNAEFGLDESTQVINRNVGIGLLLRTLLPAAYDMTRYNDLAADATTRANAVLRPVPTFELKLDNFK